MERCRYCGIKVQTNKKGFCSIECETQYSLNYGKNYSYNGE